jgi:hypothetical protein
MDGIAGTHCGRECRLYAPDLSLAKLDLLMGAPEEQFLADHWYAAP